MIYTVFHGSVVTLSRGDDGLYRSDEGVVFALRDDSTTLDPVDRCGVYPLAFNSPLDRDCRVHDYMYTSPGYQAFHSRAEADAYLENLIALEPSAWHLLAWPFYAITRLVGGLFWENKRTND